MNDNVNIYEIINNLRYEINYNATRFDDAYTSARVSYEGMYERIGRFGYEIEKITSCLSMPSFAPAFNTSDLYKADIVISINPLLGYILGKKPINDLFLKSEDLNLLSLYLTYLCSQDVDRADSTTDTIVRVRVVACSVYIKKYKLLDFCNNYLQHGLLFISNISNSYRD